jgi:uncharacterized LabA/DUF88 family protein
MENKRNNFAYIDGANLHRGVATLGWRLDYARFRVWLTEKYGVSRAYLFIGLIQKYSGLYKYLQEAGFTLVFKDTTYDGNGKPKGNCDADLVVQVMQDCYENNFEKAVIVSSDGDYASLVKLLKEKNRLEIILSPSIENKCSLLLKRTDAPIVYMNDKRSILALKEKTPDADEPHKGSFRGD